MQDPGPFPYFPYQAIVDRPRVTWPNGAHVALWHDDKRAFKHAFVVKVHLALPGPDIHAEDHGHDLYQAIDVVTDRLAEQLRHRKSKLVKGTREKSRKAKLRRQVALA